MVTMTMSLSLVTAGGVGDQGLRLNYPGLAE